MSAAGGAAPTTSAQAVPGIPGTPGTPCTAPPK